MLYRILDRLDDRDQLFNSARVTVLQARDELIELFPRQHRRNGELAQKSLVEQRQTVGPQSEFFDSVADLVDLDDSGCAAGFEDRGEAFEAQPGVLEERGVLVDRSNELVSRDLRVLQSCRKTIQAVLKIRCQTGLDKLLNANDRFGGV